MTCKVDGCDKVVTARGLCHNHYERLRVRGTTDPAPTVPLAERFWARVDRRGPDECWLWKPPKSRTGAGYGVFGRRVDGKATGSPAHRLAYELTKGEIPAGLHIDHLCNTRLCCNPAHLEAVTPRENTLRTWHRRDAAHDAGRDCGGAACSVCRVSRYRICDECGVEFAIKADGRMRRHRWHRSHLICPGSYEQVAPPVPATGSAVAS